MAAKLPPVWLTCPKCGERWQSCGKGRSSIRCPRFDECHGSAKIPRDRPRTEAEAVRQAERAAGTAPGWDDQAPGILDWPGQLGPEVVDDPYATCAGSECECSGPRFRWLPGHTATVCPECGPECWAVSAGAYRRGVEQAKATTAVARVASSPAVQAETDAAARRFERQRARYLDAIGQHLAAGLDLDSRTDLEWYAAAIRNASTPARLDQLAGQLAAETFRRAEPEPRRWWQSSPAELEPGDDGDDQDDDSEPRRELTAGQRAAAARYMRKAAGLPEPFHPVPGVVYGPGGVILSIPAGISPAGLAQLQEWNRRASGL